MSFVYLHKSTRWKVAKQLKWNTVGVNSPEHVSVSAVSRSGWTAAAEWLLPGSCTLNATVYPEAGYEQRKTMLKVY